MKIAIIGYGKMGHEVEKVALKRGHEVVSIIDEHNQEEMQGEAFRSADVAIEFTNGHVAQNNIEKAWAAGLPVVSGSTGWINALTREWIKENIHEHRLITASNFSLGMNAMFAANRLIARIFGREAMYKVKIHEVHHTQKLDHPSGSAITLAEGIVDENPHYSCWLEPTDNVLPDEGIIPITYAREGDVKGIHEVEWVSPMCDLSLRHEAKSRDGFAIGAVVAAEWLAKQEKPGHYTMIDVLENQK